MVTKISNEALLDIIIRIASDFTVDRVEHNSDNQVTIFYPVIGQGSALTNLIEEAISKLAPAKTFRIKMTPSEKKLVVELR